MSDETTTAKTTFSIPTKPSSTKQPSELVAALKKGLSSADVFEAFEALDAFPPDAVREALEPWTGPAPSTDALDARLRSAIGLPAKIPTFHGTRLRRPTRPDELSALDQEQIRRAGESWDDRDLDAAARLRNDGSEASFAGTLELISLSDASENARYDVVRFRTGNGTVFRAGTSTVAGNLADGVVELSNHEDRVALQNALSGELVVRAPAPKATPAKAAVVREAGEARSEATKGATTKAAATTKGAATTGTATTKGAATKADATKGAAKAETKAAAKKATTAKKSTAKAVSAKASSTKKAAKKATAKSAAAAKKATAKAAKAAAVKATAKKPSAATKKKATATSKKATTKGGVAKKKAKNVSPTAATRGKTAGKASASKRPKTSAKSVHSAKPVKKSASPKASSKKAAARPSTSRKAPARRSGKKGSRA